ncbi:MAG: hypothetical protein JWN44_5287 [Myxococcales bacterium]|nr:hypothetical protein [Myxococcales bacterium]
MTRAMLARILVAAGAIAVVASTPAHAYHAATHAGLTERAALASSLHKRLTERFGRALGLYEQLSLDGGDRDPARRELLRRVSQLDPESGYVPERGRMSALGWLVAGAAAEGVPADRVRNHFFDPTRGHGLDESEGEALRTRLRSAATGVGSVRGIFTGSTFDGSGMASPEWLRAADNEWGLNRFLDEMERAGAAATAAERDGALARALVAAGAVAHLVEDAGDPTFVRDDYRVALETAGGPYEQYVATRFGRLGVPDLDGTPVVKPRLGALFHDSDGSGLADRTQSRFFSPGTLPGSNRYTRPQTAPGAAVDGYGSGAVRHLVRYQKTERGIVWGLDERCFSDYAEALLPESARYAAGALELLFRGKLEVVAEHGAATVKARDVGLGKGTLSVYADVGEGPRRLAGTRAVTAAGEGDSLGEVALPAGSKRVAAVFRGVDAVGEPLVVVQEQLVK